MDKIFNVEKTMADLKIAIKKTNSNATSELINPTMPTEKIRNKK
jgi:hypothetical protein